MTARSRDTVISTQVKELQLVQAWPRGHYTSLAAGE